MFGPFKRNNDTIENETHAENEACCSAEQNGKQTETQDQVASLQKMLSQCQEEMAQTKDQFTRLGADFQNYKRRMEKDRQSWTHSIQASLLHDILSVVNDFDRAMEQAKSQHTNENLAQWLVGFELIRKSLDEFLKRNNVEPIEQMSTFDPELHEALMHVDSPDHASGAIVQVLERGFLLNGVVLKPAKVSVAK